MMPRSALRAGVGLLWSCLVVASTEVVSAPDADFVAAALQMQEDRCGGSLVAQWTMAPLRPPKAGDKPMDVRYVRTREVLFKEERWGKVTESGKVDPVWIVRYRYERVSGSYKQLTTDPGGRLVPRGAVTTSATIPSRFTSRLLVDPVLFPLTIGPLVKLVREGRVADDAEQIDGHTCWRIEIPERLVGTAVRHRWTVWVDGGIGFCPRRVDDFVTQGSVTRHSITLLTDYKEVKASVFFPQRVTRAYDDALIDTWQCTVTNVECGEEVPPADLAVVYPPRTEILLMPEGVWYKEP